MMVDFFAAERTYNKGVIGELVSVEEMLEEVGALIAGVSPRHG